MNQRKTWFIHESLIWEMMMGLRNLFHVLNWEFLVLNELGKVHLDRNMDGRSWQSQKHHYLQCDHRGSAVLVFTTADPGKLISGIESESERHLHPDVLNRSQHVLVRDQVPPCAASVWGPERQCRLKCVDFSNMDEELVSCPELQW